MFLMYCKINHVISNQELHGSLWIIIYNHILVRLLPAIFPDSTLFCTTDDSFKKTTT